MKRTALVCMAIGLGGCATQAPQTIHIGSQFDEAAAREQIADGKATVLGTAFIRQNGGNVVTCAGQDVHLIPVSAYGTERLEKIYGAAPRVGQTVFKDIKAMGKTTFVPDIPAYAELSKKTKCDAQGNFEFEQVKNGSYYVSTGVLWIVGARQGGALTTQVRVENNKPPKLIITP